jgi:hypothetical protein
MDIIVKSTILMNKMNQACHQAHHHLTDCQPTRSGVLSADCVEKLSTNKRSRSGALFLFYVTRSCDGQYQWKKA